MWNIGYFLVKLKADEEVFVFSSYVALKSEIHSREINSKSSHKDYSQPANILCHGVISCCILVRHKILISASHE